MRVNTSSADNLLAEEGGQRSSVRESIRRTLQMGAEQPPQLAAEVAQGQAGKVGTAINMACNIMGGALLVLPTSMNDASIVPGLALVILFGLMSISTMVMLSHAAETRQQFSYRTLVENSAHLRLAQVLEVMLFFYTFGVLVEYGRIIVDSMPSVMTDMFHLEGVITEGWLWILMACCVFFPLTSLKALAKLKWTSLLGLVTIMYILIMVVVRFFDGSYRSGESLVSSDVKIFSIHADIFKSVPVLAVSFSCHYNIPYYYKELQGRSPVAFSKVILLVMPWLIYLYGITGLLGYLTFGRERVTKTEGNIVNAFGKSDLAINIGRLGLFFHFVTAYPIVAIGCRNCLNNIIFGTPNRPTFQYIIEAFILVSVAGFLAYLVPGIGIVVSIIGSLFGVCIVLVIPAVIYIGTYKEGSWLPWRKQQDQQISESGSKMAEEPAFELEEKRVPKNRCLFCLAYVYVPTGIVLAIIAFIVTLVKEFE